MYSCSRWFGSPAMRHCPAFLLASVVGCARAPAHQPAAVPLASADDSSPAGGAERWGVSWNQMIHALPGTWKAQSAAGASVTETFRLVSNGSALVESFVTPSGRETVSVYHRDHDRLMLTHYCGQGNQPRLRAAVVRNDS